MWILIMLALALALCSPALGEEEEESHGGVLPVPSVALPRDASAWAPDVTHPFFPLRPGTTWVYGSKTGTLDSVTVTFERRKILGISAVVVRDREYHGKVLVEDTRDWYAQDVRGNVWYLGEDSRQYSKGRLSSTEGSWEAGQRGAQAGLIMPAKLRVGETYRQEFLRGEAEDVAKVIALDGSVVVPAGRYAGCVVTEEWSALEPDVREHKVYAKGVGLVRERTVEGGHGELVLLKVSGPKRMFRPVHKGH
jgi:hypothetical protein